MFTSTSIIGEKALRQLLGIGRTTFWSWRKTGMPATSQGRPGRENTYDLAGVLSWLQESGNQFDFRPTSQTPDRCEVLRHEVAVRELARPDALTHAQALALQVAAELEGGLVADLRELRAALRAVPVSRRAALEMPITVWDELTANVRVLELEIPLEGELHEDETEEMGEFWYDVACGRIRRAVDESTVKPDSKTRDQALIDSGALEKDGPIG